MPVVGVSVSMVTVLWMMLHGVVLPTLGVWLRGVAMHAVGQVLELLMRQEIGLVIWRCHGTGYRCSSEGIRGVTDRSKVPWAATTTPTTTSSPTERVWFLGGVALFLPACQG